MAAMILPHHRHRRRLINMKKPNQSPKYHQQQQRLKNWQPANQQRKR